MKTLKESSHQQKFTPANNLKIIVFKCCNSALSYKFINAQNLIVAC